jgi:hypothetical protein
MTNIFLTLFLLTIVVVPSPAQNHDNLQPPTRKHYKYDGKIVTSYDQTKNQTLVLIQLPYHDVVYAIQQ